MGSTHLTWKFNKQQDLVAPLKTIYQIHCYNIVNTDERYFVEGIATANREKLEKHLPWVFDGRSLPRSIKVDKGLDDWSTEGIKVTWNALSRRRLEIFEISNVQECVEGKDEFDLYVGLWVKRAVLETMAPSLLKSRFVDTIGTLEKKTNSGPRSHCRFQPTSTV